RPTGNADQQAFFLGQAARQVYRVFDSGLDNLVNVVSAQNLGNESGANTLNFVRTGLPSGEHRTIFRFDRDHAETWLFRLDVLGHSSDRPACADAGDQEVHFAFSIVRYFRAGGLEVDLGIGRIGELLRHV